MAVLLPLNQLVQLLTLKKKPLLTHVQIFMSNNDVNGETLWLNQRECFTTSSMVLILNISLFSTDNFVKISMGRSCNPGISALAYLFVRKTNTTVRNYLVRECQHYMFKIACNVTAKMLRPRSLDRSGSQLFMTTEWINRAIRNCIIEILILFFSTDILKMV